MDHCPGDIWSGDILLDENTTVKEIILTTQNNASTAIPASALRFLSTVDTARIPLYLATGPSIDVWTTSEDTQAWFESILLSKAPSASNVDVPENGQTQAWWTCARSQSPVGILVQVEGGLSDGKSPRITEILFYGTIAVDSTTTLITPASSSALGDGDVAELRVHALQLSSDLLHRPSVETSGPQSRHDAQFLPSPLSLVPTAPGSPKRKRDQFDEAIQAGKKARRKGGQGIAAAAGAGKVLSLHHPPLTHRKSMSIDSRGTPFPELRPASVGGPPSRPASRNISRSPSISSDTRPLSKKGLPDGNSQAKRSMLSHVATVPVKPEEPTTESRNKEALARVVLAAMRMHGLQQRKKPKSRRGSVAPGVELATEQLSDEALAEEAAKDEEYKLIYSLTYKGAALALRKHIATEPLHLQSDRFHDIVEKLLAIFCEDPLAPSVVEVQEERGASVLATPGGKGLAVPVSTHSRNSPFDLPSVNRVSGAPTGSKVMRPTLLGAVDMGSPVSRRVVKGKAVEDDELEFRRLAAMDVAYTIQPQMRTLDGAHGGEEEGPRPCACGQVDEHEHMDDYEF